MRDQVLLHIPHSSVEIPSDVRKGILLSDAELAQEILILTDLSTDELFVLAGSACVRNEYSRLVFDPERFRDDRDESMAGFGMGAIYVATAHGRPMRNLTPADRERMMARFYDPYHAALEGEVARIMDTHGRCLIVDGHSFPSKPLPFEADQDPARPDICIGTSDFHTPEALTALVEGFCAARGLSTKRDSPFAGTMTPMRYYRKEPGVQSVMIEVNRRLYMDETTGRKLPGFADVARLVHELLEQMADRFPNAG